MEKILIIDTSAVMYKSHFAMINLINSKGQHTGALFGVVKQLEVYLKKLSPKYVVAAHDVKRSSLNRTKIYDKYKANRSSMPEELVGQLEDIRNLIKYYGISSYQKETYEADDIIATLCNFGINNNLEVHILTGDKDLQQLVNEKNNVYIHLLSKDYAINTYEGVKEYMGVYPYQIVDYFGLMGDNSDGIPGVKGIGSVTAQKLITEYGNLENLYNNIENIKGKLKEKLINDKEMAFLSRKLAKVEKNVELDISLKDIEIKEKDIESLYKLYLDRELNSLLSTLNKKEEIKEIKLNVNRVDFKDIISIIDKSNKFSLYRTDEYMSIAIKEDVYICKLEEENSLLFTDYSIKKDSSVEAIVYDAKNLLHKNICFDNFFDVLIASYVIDTETEFEIEKLSSKYLDYEIPIYDKKKLKNISQDDIVYKQAQLTYAIYKLEDILKKELKLKDSKNVYGIIEKPLISVLYTMEKNGIKISKEVFRKQKVEFSTMIEEKTKKIYELSNSVFNIDSPQQLSEILFNKLKIKPIKKTKTGYSTDAQVLEELAENNIEIAKEILEYRTYKKLLSTYIEPLPLYADIRDRIHSSFNATGTATGRLSSQNPNLQNIPTRSKLGSMIRSGFVADEGKVLISFDYSQIELRVLAEMSKDINLIRAYNEDLDLHSLTAKKLFKTESIDKEQRNIAKTINFSVLYGKTAFGLSKELKITMKDAKTYIDKYFEEYSSVLEFTEQIVENAKKNKYVETMFGTRRYISDINSKNALTFAQAKRIAINTVIQGTAANIIKLVMIELSKKNYNMLIQVHDELIFEADKDEAEKIAQEIKEIMENTIIFDNVKLKVNYEIANNWGDLK